MQKIGAMNERRNAWMGMIFRTRKINPSIATHSVDRKKGKTFKIQKLTKVKQKKNYSQRI